MSTSGLNFPALLPPPGVTSNFVNPPTRARDLVIACSICISFMIVCVAIRFYTKLCIKHTWGWDDWTCVPATIGSVGFAAVVLSTLGEGVGPHQWDVSFTAFTPSLLRRFVVLDMLYSPTILMAKLSLLSLYLQIFGPNVKLRYVIYFTMTFISLFYASTFIAYGILSIPRPGQTQLQAIVSVNTAKDIPLGIAQGIVGVVTDFQIFCLPIPVIWKLQLPRSKKIGVLAVFTTGLLACIASAFGLYYRVNMGRNDDVTWKLTFVLLWVIVELTVGVMCSCLPTFPGFFRYYLPLLKSIVSRFSSTFKSLRLSKTSSNSNKSYSSKRLATKDMKISLGSRVDGRGKFVNSTSLFAMEDPRQQQSQVARSPLSRTHESGATRRDYFEKVAESQQSAIHDDQIQAGINSYPPSEVEHENSVSGPPQRRWWKMKTHRSGADQTGYWDILSVFRAGVANSSVQARPSSEG